MLDHLRRREEASIQGERALELLHHFLAFLDDAHDGVAGLRAWRFFHFFEHFLKTHDVLFGLGLVLFEGGFQRLRLGGLRQFGKGAQIFFSAK